MGTAEEAPDQGGVPLPLDQTAQELVLAEVGAVLEQVSGESRARYLELWQGVAAGEVPPEALETLAQLLRLGVETGRVRRVHGQAAETLARALYARTPAGQLAEAQASALTRALQVLNGATLQGLSVAAAGPGCYRLTLLTDRGETVLRLDPAGLGLESVIV